MEHLIITNNTLVRDKYDNVRYLEGSIEELLIAVRNLIYRGYKISSYPLPGNMKTLPTPIKSVVLHKTDGEVNIEQLRIIEESIEKLAKNKKFNVLDFTYEENYKKLDFELLESAIDK